MIECKLIPRTLFARRLHLLLWVQVLQEVSVSNPEWNTKRLCKRAYLSSCRIGLWLVIKARSEFGSLPVFVALPLANVLSLRMAPISQYQLGTSPPAGLNLTPFTRSVPSNKSKSPPTAGTPEAGGSSSRSETSAFVNQPGANQSVDKVPHIITDTKQQPKASASATSLHDASEEIGTPTTPSGEHSARTGKPSRRRQGTMQKDFKFPSPSPSPAGDGPPTPPKTETKKLEAKSEAGVAEKNEPDDDEDDEAEDSPAGSPAPPAEPKKTPAPPPLPELPPEPTRKHSQSGMSAITDEEVGDTVEVDLS